MVVAKQFWKSVPSSLRWLVHPALLIALGLHAIALLMPLPNGRWGQPDQSEVTEPDLEVALSPLPSRMVASPPAAVPQPSPVPVNPKPVASPLPPVMPQAQLARPVVPPPPRPVVRPAASPIAAAPVASPSPTPLPSPDPVPPLAIPFGNLPQLAGTEVGCFGLSTCHQLSNGTSFRSAGQTLEAELQAQGYQVRARDDLEETGRKVYEISKDNKTRFLNVLSTDVGTTVYLVTPEPIQVAELQTSETLKTALSTLLDSLSTTAASPAQFSQPNAFYASAVPHPGTDGRLRWVAGETPNDLLTRLTPTLQSQGFSLQAAGGYGSGWLYEITQGAYTGYLNLVPTVDQQGTIVVLWQALPQSP